MDTAPTPSRSLLGNFFPNRDRKEA